MLSAESAPSVVCIKYEHVYLTNILVISQKSID